MNVLINFLLQKNSVPQCSNLTLSRKVACKKININIILKQLNQYTHYLKFLE